MFYVRCETLADHAVTILVVHATSYVDYRELFVRRISKYFSIITFGIFWLFMMMCL